MKGGGKCRYHGGNSTGPRTAAGKAKTRHNSTKDGIYSSTLNEQDRQWLDELTEGDSLDQEIRLARLQIRRALAAWEKWEGENPEPILPTVDGIQRTDAKGRTTAEVHRRRPDLYAIIDRALGRVGRLVQQQATVIEIRDLKDMIEEGLANAPEAPK